jgi:hypothetical protein
LASFSSAGVAIKHLISGAAAALLLAACVTPDATDPTSRYYEFPTTTSVVVEQEIAIPPGTAHAKLQGGATVPHAQLRRYEPHCELEVNDVLDTAQSVHPGHFAVTRIQRQQQWGALETAILLAAAAPDGEWVTAGSRIGGSVGVGIGFGTRVGRRDDGGGSFALYSIHLRLQSAEQPNVRELRCNAGWDIMPHVQYPTLAEMRAALGPLIRIAIP